ncbi:MAG: hypothetical protein ACTSXE_02820 [Candidatus Thorarchaeota archaeon]
MLIKKGVILTGLQLEMRDVLISYGSACRDISVVGEVTSGLEGQHSYGSYHYYGYALDLSIKGMTDGEVGYIEKSLRRDLRAFYDVMVERTHIHVEFDVNKAKMAGYRKEF